MSRTRVVITGIGWVTPMGHDIETVWQGLLSGGTGISHTALFDADTFPTTFSAQVKDYDPASFVDMTPFEHVGRNTRFALGAAKQAWDMAGLADFDPTRIGLYLGSGEGSLDYDAYTTAALTGWDDDTREIDTKRWADAAAKLMHARREHEQEPNMPLSHVARLLGLRGPSFNCLTACAASCQAIGEATALLRRGDADAMLVGGAHSMIHPFGVTGFNRLTALSERSENPPGASRPFDANRGGFVLGEGSGMLVIETLDSAQARGATVLAEVLGYGSTADAFRITDQHPEGEGARVAMQLALDDADVRPADVDYINAHGTGTKENDSTETKAIKAVFGGAAKTTPVSSIKSMMGHLIAASGAVELITCVLAMRDKTLPPTMNYETPDPACDLDYVPNAARPVEKLDIAMSNNFGFGGQNDTIVIGRFAE
ncbi:MAG: beta-ketoacyl-[acyl-carrier-protein] synthase family protein [Planctomycetota bacterium]